MRTNPVFNALVEIFDGNVEAALDFYLIGQPNHTSGSQLQSIMFLLQEEPDDGMSNMSLEQLVDIYFALPETYRAGLIAPRILNAGTGTVGTYMDNSSEFREALLQAHQLYLQDLFLGSATRTNLSGFTNMSNSAMAAFMLSHTRLEYDNWNADLNIIRATPPDDRSAGQQLRASLGSQVRLIQDVFSWVERQFYGQTTRVAGASIGISNIWAAQVDEAWQLHEQYGLLDVDNLRTERGIFSYFPRDVNEDPFFATRAFGLVFNWIGARQRKNIGAGSDNIPAFDLEGDLNSQLVRPVDEVSAFSLSLTRYSDAVDAAGIDFNSSTFGMMITSVEGVDEAAHTLGLTFGDEQSDIVLGQDFTPYTPEQATTIVETIRAEISSGNERYKELLCGATMLQDAYEANTGISALQDITCP